MKLVLEVTTKSFPIALEMVVRFLRTNYSRLHKVVVKYVQNQTFTFNDNEGSHISDESSHISTGFITSCWLTVIRSSLTVFNHPVCFLFSGLFIKRCCDRTGFLTRYYRRISFEFLFELWNCNVGTEEQWKKRKWLPPEYDCVSLSSVTLHKDSKASTNSQFNFQARLFCFTQHGVFVQFDLLHRDGSTKRFVSINIPCLFLTTMDIVF
jgi:hypothetical protein